MANDDLSWCTPQLVNAVALVLGGSDGPARIEVSLARDAAPGDIPRRYRIDGEWVAIASQVRRKPQTQAARASNLDVDAAHDGMVSAIVRDRLQHDRYYLLSCGHVLAGNARARKGDRIELSDDSRMLGYGTLEDWAPVLGEGIPQVGIDAGIVRIDFDPFATFPAALLPQGVSTSYRLDQEVVLQVGKGLRGTLKTRWSGYVDMPGTARLEDYYLENAIGYQVEGGTAPGDSGAAVWNADGKLIGIHVGGPAGDERWRSNAVLCPIDKIMDWFDVEPILSDGRAFDAIPAGAAVVVRPSVPVDAARPPPVAAPPPPPPRPAPPAPAPPPASVSEEIDVIAMTLWGEARGEKERGMEAVACVIGNRAKRKQQGKPDFAGVCRRRWQFSCWNENDPNRARLEVVRRNPDADFRLAAGIAGRLVRNELDDFTFGATHYFASSMPKRPYWAVNKEPCYRLGKHLFFNNID